MDQEKLTLARRLRDAGCPLLPENEFVKAGSQGLSIMQEGFFETSLFDMEPGGTGCMLYLVIANDLPRQIVLVDFELQLPWKELTFQWLADPAVHNGGNLYRFPSNCGPEFPREDVINHRAYEKGKLGRGGFLRGVLLGFSYKALPANIKHGETLDASLSVFDVQEKCYSAEISFWIDRSAKLDPKPARKSTRQPLFPPEELNAQSDCSPEACEPVTSKG